MKIILINDVTSCDIERVNKYLDKLYKREIINKYVFNKDKIRAIISEILIRVAYCEGRSVDNDDIRFEKNKYGKPFIINSNDFKFNVSHSDEMVVVAIDNEDIGVDIEKIQNIDKEVAKIFCTENECNVIANSKEEEVKKISTSIWSLKEAYVKYLGVGISKELNSFDVISKYNINSNINLKSIEYNGYCLSICSEKNLDLNSIIQEISVDELLQRYDTMI